MPPIGCVRVSGLGIIFTLIAPVLTMAEDGAWRKALAEDLPLLGHRNWIVIADAAYPLQSAEGITTIATDDEQIAVLKKVLAALGQSKHVRPMIYLDAELPFVSEDDAPEITAYRNELASFFEDHATKSLPHEEIIARLDNAAENFRVLILKTNMRLPYTSVFIELDCGYWSPEAEKRLRQAMQQAKQK